MKTVVFSVVCVFCAILTSPIGASAADPDVAVLDEKVSKLSAQMEDLQFRTQQLQKDMEKVQSDLQEVRRAAGGVSPDDLHALEKRVEDIDAARQKDREVIIDQLAKELASIKNGKAVTPPANPGAAPATDDSTEHVVVKGENLTAIAKSCGVSVAALRKANNLTTDEIKVGQKLTIPKPGQN